MSLLFPLTLLGAEQADAPAPEPASATTTDILASIDAQRDYLSGRIFYDQKVIEHLYIFQQNIFFYGATQVFIRGSVSNEGTREDRDVLKCY